MDIFLLTQFIFKSKNKYFINASILLLNCLVLTACGGGGGGADPVKPVPASSQTISSSTLSSKNFSSTNVQVTSSFEHMAGSSFSSALDTSSSEQASSLVPSSAANSSISLSSQPDSSSFISSSIPSSVISSSSVSSFYNSSAISSSLAMSSFNGTLDIAMSTQDVYINEPVYLRANISEGSNWNYHWRVINDEVYQRKDLFGLTWDSSILNSECTPQQFGLKVSGKLYAPRTGLYRFVVAADTRHEFYLTKNGVNNRLTYSTIKTGKAEFFTNPQQQSEWIELQAGSAYPIELFYLKTDFQGHYSVLWQQPGSSTWDEIPDTVYSKPDESVATGVLQQEIVKGLHNSFDNLRAQLHKIENPGDISPRVYAGIQIGIAPQSYDLHTLELTATSGNRIVRKQISFYPEARFVSEDHAYAAQHWFKSIDGAAQLSLTNAGDGSATGNVLQIEITSSARHAEWYSTVRLKPYTAYEVRARVRLLNAPNNLPIISGMGDSKSWTLPRLRVGVHGDASEQGIDPRTPGMWRDIAVDFIVPFHGIVDLHANMGEYTGKFQIDNLRLVKLTGDSVTHFDFPNLSANIYNDIVTRTGGIEATRRYFTRIAQAAADMRELSGKYSYAQCQKENIFIPRHWSVFALGTNYNNMILKTPDLLTTDFLTNVWGSTNIVGGVMVHEIEHSFDFPGSSFNAHLPVLLQAYAMDKRGLLRTAGSDFINVDQWMEGERKNYGECFSNPGALIPKLFEFQKLLPADQKWEAFKKVMHDRWSPYKIEVEDRRWPTHWGSDYEQYRAWWRELKSYTGLDGWELLHTSTEQQRIEKMYRRMSPFYQSKNPATLPATETQLRLNDAVYISGNVGWGNLEINGFTSVNGNCVADTIYAHAPSTITYQLNKQWKLFNSGAFIKDNSPWGNVAARILGDGVELYRSTPFTASSGLVTLPAINVANVNQLTLEFLDMGDTNSDWSVWVEPTLTR